MEIIYELTDSLSFYAFNLPIFTTSTNEAIFAFTWIFFNLNNSCRLQCQRSYSMHFELCLKQHSLHNRRFHFNDSDWNFKFYAGWMQTYTQLNHISVLRWCQDEHSIQNVNVKLNYILNVSFSLSQSLFCECIPFSPFFIMSILNQVVFMFVHKWIVLWKWGTVQREYRFFVTVHSIHRNALSNGTSPLICGWRQYIH